MTVKCALNFPPSPGLAAKPSQKPSPAGDSEDATGFSSKNRLAIILAALTPVGALLTAMVQVISAILDKLKAR